MGGLEQTLMVLPAELVSIFITCLTALSTSQDVGCLSQRMRLHTKGHRKHRRRYGWYKDIKAVRPRLPASCLCAESGQRGIGQVNGIAVKTSVVTGLRRFSAKTVDWKGSRGWLQWILSPWGFVPTTKPVPF